MLNALPLTGCVYRSVIWLLSDIAFKDGKVGDYLFLGNMVYTVRVPQVL